MASSDPPSPYFNGIIYNPSFFESSGTALTTAEANNLYLRKTTTDTATALETFTAGISTNSIAPYNVATTTNLFDTLTSGVLNIATNALRSGKTNIGYYSTTDDAELSLTGGTGGAYLASYGSLTLASSSLIQMGSYPTKTSEIRIGYWPTSVATMDGAINIGTLNTLTSSPTNIYAGIGGIQLSAVGDVSLTSSTGSIKNNSDTYISSGRKLFTNAIDTATAGLLTLGGANCTGITFSNSIQSFTLGANQFISYGANTAVPTTASTQLGYRYQVLNSSAGVGLSTTDSIIVSFSMPVGTWIAEYTGTTSSGAGFARVSLSSTSSFDSTRSSSTNTSGSGTVGGKLMITTVVAQATTASTWNIIAAGIGTQNLGSNSVYLTRIA